MSLFDIFKKAKYPLPEMYKNIISKEEYNVILEICQEYHKEKGFQISKIDEGDIVTEVDGEVQHRYLDNLVRQLASNEKSKWQTLVYKHFDKLIDKTPAYNYLFKDFDYASQFIRVLIKPDDINFGDTVSGYVHRIDFPGTFTFLVIEFEEQFRYVKRSDIPEWEKSEEELFQMGISNTPDNEIEAKQYLYCDKFPVNIFFSGDYSASLMLDIKNRADFSIGTYGTLISIPTKGTAFTHPIENKEILELIQTLAPSVVQFYNEDQGNISKDFYWYYNDQYEKFPIDENENGTFVQMPNKLMILLQESK